ncbi:hypothetical protein ACJ41O_005499 [Fusarium nematophilum]
MKLPTLSWLLVNLTLASSVLGQDTEVVQSPIDVTKIPQRAIDIWKDIKTDAVCLGCHVSFPRTGERTPIDLVKGIVWFLKALANLGDDVFVAFLQESCKAFAGLDADVCDGTVALEGPVIASSIRKIQAGSRESQMLCAGLIGLCNFPAVEQYEVPVTPVPAYAALPKPKDTGDVEMLRIAHFSDIHIDPEYTVGANTNCSKPMCCRPYTPDDEPGKNNSPAGPFGDHECGSPLSLEQSMYAAIQRMKPDLAIFTGDIVDHAIWNTSVEQNELEISTAYQHMVEVGLSPVYGTVGNHEQSPANAIPPTHLGISSAQWLYDLVASLWERWVGPQPEVKAFGAYSVKHPKSNLRVISFSTNMYYTLNFWLYQDIRKDPDDQLAWLVKELDKAEREGERVYLVGHMPMGNPDAFYDGSNYFDQVVNRYKSTIAAMFFGHTHVDEFQLSYSDYKNRQHDKAVAMSYIAPALTPRSGMPAFRIYHVHPQTFEVMDVVTYIADMSDPTFQDKPVWTEYYSARDTYGPLVRPPLKETSSLSPSFWHNVTIALESDRRAFDEYWAKRTRGWEVKPCGADCWAAEICQLRAARSENNCYVPKPGDALELRSEEKPRGDSTKCDQSVVAVTLRSLVVRKDGIQSLEKKVKDERARRR